MRRIGFLAKLRMEERISIVEPSAELKDAYIGRSRESLSSARILLEAGNLRDSVSLIYYSMYHTVIALLFRIGVKCENHSASIIMLKDVFGLDDSRIKKAKKERVDKQYYADIDVTRNEVVELLREAEEFNGWLHDFIERLNSESVKRYGRDVLELVGDI